MKKKSLSKGKELWRKQLDKRQKRMWECVRRNKDYIHDFDLSKSEKLNDAQISELRVKWNIWLGEGLGDPSESAKIQEEDAYYPYPYPHFPSSIASYFTHYRLGKGIKSGKHVSIFCPGKVIVSLKKGKKNERKVEDWEIEHKGKFEKLTKKNCPHWISICINVEPWFPKLAVERTLMEKFEQTYELIKDAQTAVLKKKSLGPRDDDEFEKFMTVFDYRDKNPKITLNDIALKTFPDSTYENKKGKKCALPWAIDNVRYYLERADYYINKQGWREL